MQSAPEQMVVDGGYISSNNIAEMAKRGIDLVGPQSENSPQKPIGASRISTTA